jgi:glutathione synthase
MTVMDTGMDIVVVSDPLDRLDPTLDTTLGIVSAAIGRGHQVRACGPADLAIVDGAAVARTYDVRRGDTRWTRLGDADAVLLRTDPPVDRGYLDATLVLDRVDPARTLMVNHPRGVRIANEKLWALEHPDLCPPTLVTASAELIADFVGRHRECVIKPIDGFSGHGVLRLGDNDPNSASIIELLTRGGHRQVVVQPWLERVRDGNKRLFVHDGDPVAAALRLPVENGDFRIGLPARMVAVDDRDREICDRLRPGLRDLGLFLVGLDVIDGQLIEVNVTSSGALRKCDRLLGSTLCADFVELMEDTTQGRSS